ncbi:bile acid:sodium symporter family protein [Siminovitchia acidinfaciens]|uniref:bile acid:sodium symporter family protein n=1 Tax=Siminovitchia acidinfaciens TaxID=2321395 RepID=UPI0013DF5CD4|nr:bile acid:sodium symporter family protein [Siminovitchia acidinfaciens]
MKFIVLINHAVTKYLPAWIVISALFAYWVPSLFNPLMDWTGFMLGFILFLMGLTIPAASISYVFKQPRTVLFGVVFKWTFTVLLTIGLGMLFLRQHHEILAGFILAGSVPSATAASLYTFIADGTVILSITMSVVDTLISPILTPFIMEHAVGHLIPIDYLSLVSQMLMIVLLPILAGMAIKRYLPSFVDRVRPAVRFCSSITLIAIVLSVVAGSQALIKVNLKLLPILILITIAQIILPMIAVFAVSRKLKINPMDSKAILFEAGLCNTALAAILAINHISFLAAVPAVINTVLNLSLGAWIAAKLGKI